MDFVDVATGIFTAEFPANSFFTFLFVCVKVAVTTSD